MKLSVGTVLSLIAATASMVNAHATLQYINDNSDVVRAPPSNNPVMDVTSSDMACNVNGGTPKSSVLTVAAGSSVTLEWHHGGRDTQAIDPSHKGPVITYLAKVPDATTATNPASLKWFKIYQDGLSGETWGVDKLVANNGKYTHTIPSSIPSGDYLIRSEIIALHAAGTYPGAQFYMGCGQLRVTGGGNANPPTVSLPGAYKGTDAGIQISIYYPKVTNYIVPGPAVFSG
ncbi:glycoside hydrolase [Ascobolus immersus RN42]|uniref:AA9 family lytic polysaccharide monooxygenase n=1 Tax=Ascobolus immersus RN42 TaxID=1160509 RepID=A0A3N4IVJ7_ASCIM|nr:glycoside hydrolase [Ascobolus immersus RN42]